MFSLPLAGKRDLTSLESRLGTINGQAESGQQKWNETLAKNLRSYIKEHPDEFPKTGNDENVDGESCHLRRMTAAPMLNATTIRIRIGRS